MLRFFKAQTIQMVGPEMIRFNSFFFNLSHKHTQRTGNFKGTKSRKVKIKTNENDYLHDIVYGFLSFDTIHCRCDHSGCDANHNHKYTTLARWTISAHA